MHWEVALQHFSASRIGQLLSYSRLADAIATAVARDDIQCPERMHLRSGSASTDALLIMPAWRNGGHAAVKVVTVRSGNAARGLPTVQGILVLFDDVSGRALATFDATALTGWRTAAASLLAARYLAPKNSRVLVMAGAGAIAAHLIRAYSCEFPLQEVVIWSRTVGRAKELARKMSLGADVCVSVVEDLQAATRRADILSCATSAEDGLIKGTWLRAGTHVDLVGAFKPHMRESDDELIQRAEVFVDTRPGALQEAGDLVQPLRAGAISEAHVRGDLASLVRDRVVRSRDSAITVFKSVGFALEDLVAAEVVLGAHKDEDVSRET